MTLISSDSAPNLENPNNENEIESFAHAISHQLRNSVTVIKGNAEILIKKPALLEQCTEKIISQSKKLLAFSDNLITFSSVGKNLDNIKEISLESVIKNIYGRVKQDNVNVELNLKLDVPAVYADIWELENIFIHLLQNAICFRDQSKDALVVDIYSYINKNNVIISVKDNGIGVSELDLYRIFKTGVSLGRGKGAGMGLAIVKKIMNSYNGEVWAESNGDNNGTTFYLKFPNN